MNALSITSQKRQQIIDITSLLNDFIDHNGLEDGILTVHCPHTTAGISVNENADPDVKRDMTSFLNKMVPQNAGFAHMEGNSDAHIKSSLVGFSQNFIVEGSTIQLGTWQGVFFMEFDGPRTRQIWLKFIPA